MDLTTIAQGVPNGLTPERVKLPSDLNQAEAPSSGFKNSRVPPAACPPVFAAALAASCQWHPPGDYSHYSSVLSHRFIA